MPPESQEDANVIGDFISRGMDQIIDEEFGGKKAAEEDKEPSGRPSKESEDEKESKLLDPDDGKEIDETSEEEDKDDDKDEEEDDEEDEDKDEESDKDKAKPKSAIAAARADKEFAALLKKHPEIEKDYFAGREYGKLFDSVEQAQEVLETKEYVDGLVRESLKGDPAPFLESLFEAAGENKADFVRFVLNLLPTIHEQAPKLAQKVIEKPIINLFAQLGSTAEERGDDQLAIAVKLCMKELFGKGVIPQGTRIEKLIKDTRDVDREKEELNRTAETDFYNSIQNVLVPTLETEIEKHLSEDSNISDGVKELIVEKALELVFSTLNADDKHKAAMKRLKNVAKANRFSSEYKKKVAREVLDAAKAIIPDITSKIEGRVLGSVRKKQKPSNGNNNRDEDVDIGGRGKPNNSHAGGGGNDIDPNDIDFSQTSIRAALDFDPKKITLKRKRR